MVDSNYLKNSNLNWLVKLKSVYDTLKSAERKAADLLLTNPKTLADLSITDAARTAGCSEATFVRLAKKIGYKGYHQLRGAIEDSTGTKEISLYPNLCENDQSPELLKKVFSASVRTIQDTLNIIDIRQYEAAVEALSRANKIAFFAIGDASSVALSGYYKFIRIGLNCSFFADPDYSLISSVYLKPGDAAVAISYSGETANVVEAIKKSKEAGAATIAITNFPLSPLAKESKIILQTAAFAHHLDGELMAHRVTQLCILESLYVAVFLKRKQEIEQLMPKVDEALKSSKLK